MRYSAAKGNGMYWGTSVGAVGSFIVSSLLVWGGYVHQFFEKPGFALVVAVWLGIAAVLMQFKGRLRYVGTTLFAIAAIFAVSWLLPNGYQPYFNLYRLGNFSFAVPNDFHATDQTSPSVNFQGDVPNRTLKLSAGTSNKDPMQWLSDHFDADKVLALQEHKYQPNGTLTPYLLSSRISDGFYVVSWDDPQAIDHYKVLVAIKKEDKTEWAMFDLTTPLSHPSDDCKEGVRYMLDTLLVSANIMFFSRPPECPNEMLRPIESSAPRTNP